MITALSEPAVHAVDACAQVRPIRRVAVAVQRGEGGDFAFHAVDGDDAALTWTGTLQAATADAAVLDVFVRIRMEVDPLDRIRFLVDFPRGSLLWVHQDEVRGALPRCTVQGPGPRDAELMAAAAAGLSPGPASGEPMETARLMLPPLTVAADGSVRGRFCGYGWLASDGQHELAGRVDSKKVIGRRASMVAELRAINDAVHRLTSSLLR